MKGPFSARDFSARDETGRSTSATLSDTVHWYIPGKDTWAMKGVA
jgi:hypothetical protein